MVSVPLFNPNVVNEVHPEKAPFPTLRTEPGIVKELRDVQYENDSEPMDLTLLGMEMDARELHCAKVELPM